MPSRRLLEAVAVCCELTGTDLSTGAARALTADLSQYPEDQVLGALQRCRRELRSRLTLADILSRLDDGRPAPEEAWSMVPRAEDASCFWTSEMREAFFVAYPLVKEGELVQARMAFLEAYRGKVQLARDASLPVKWEFSPGHSKDGRELALLDAVEKGRLSVTDAANLLPNHREDVVLTARLLALAKRALPALPR